MRIAIVGPGALGCLFASLLAPKKQLERDSLRLLDHNRERADLLNRQGIVYETGSKQERSMIPVSVELEPLALSPIDVVLFCVKSHDLQSCVQFYLPLLSPQTLIVFLQNGIGHLDIQTRLNLPTTPAFACSSEGATLLSPGHVLHAGRGSTHLGFLQDATGLQQQQLKELTQNLQEAGIEASLSEDIRSQLWAKLFINAGINPLTALYKRTNGQLLTSCAARSRLKNIVREAEAVARGCGITINVDPVQATLAVCKSTARNISSMLQDRRNKRPTEIDAINGAVVKEGKRLGISTPFNDEVVEQIKKMENEYNLGTVTK
ncbi:MAG: 2-dehydropantoate 2-reductase [Proteobacteria bacterium]|nr:2-dehydropantoate 2-reductase [Pseudomonadota bacterium]MBU1648947.1 2-dehydropantoate 2-reductase [Pseudomonadota bacterium]MBU1985667.1 2-dehydropantoate 2-reductase [Pseudomonadota bacterium]